MVNGMVTAKILVGLNVDWLAKQEASAKTPIESFISAFAGKDPDIVLVRHDETSCDFETFYISGRREELEDQLVCAFQDSLDIEPTDHLAWWKIIVSEYGVERVISHEGLSPEERCALIPPISWRVILTLNDGWVLERRNAPVLPIEEFLEQFCKAFVYSTIERESLTKCSVIINTETRQEIEEKLDAVIQTTGLTEAVLEKSIEELPRLEETGAEPSEKPVETTVPAVCEKIQQLIGVPSFHILATLLTKVAPQIHANHTLDSFHRRCYLFMISDGCGLSTQLQYLSLLFRELKLSRGEQVIEVPADKTLQEMLEEVSGSYLNKTLISFDISRWMDKIRQIEFRSFLKQLASKADRPIYVFRIPFVDDGTHRKVLAGLSDVFTIQEVTTDPYSIENYKQYAARLLSEKRFSMDEGGWKAFEERIAAEKSEGQFYGLNTVQKIVDDLFFYKHISVAFSERVADERLITADHMAGVIYEQPDMRPAMEQLEDLVGIKKIRERLLEVMAQIEVAKSDPALRPCLHMRFVGGPGTGKTTVARILGQMMKERGLLSKGQFFEYAGRDFCGQYIGETAPKTAAMCRDAYGSVLFIDEAYSLYRGDKDNKDYGREAIDTLVSQMENHRQDFMVIMAGYAEDMDLMMEGNVGLASRMPYTITFPGYNREELSQIFMQMAGRSFTCETGLEAAVKSYFESLGDAVLKSKEFANARFVRNLFERTWGKASIRRQLDPNGAFHLCTCDFEQAINDQEFQELQQRKSKKIGFC